MAKPKQTSEQTRARIVARAGQGIRRHGYGGVGVDAIAREAGVTAGAFYGHFDSKAEVFRDALAAGLDDLRGGIATVQQQAGAAWLDAFVDFYLSDRRTCDLADSCALQSLSMDAARADDATRAVYEAAWLAIRDTAAAGLDGTAEQRRAHSTALLALLVGGVSIARAVRRPEVAEAVATATRAAAHAVAGAARPAASPSRASSSRRPAGERSDPAAIGELARTLEDAWNCRDAVRIARAHHADTVVRDRAEQAHGRAALVELLARRWRRELDARRIIEVFAAGDRRVTLRTVCEWRDDSGHAYRSAGVELWQLDGAGLIVRCEESINDALIHDADRLLRWPAGPRPALHPGLSALAL